MLNIHKALSGFTATIFAAASFSASATVPSGTLPVITINTENGTPVTSKETYLRGTYWLNPNGADGIKAIGSESEPLPLQIKGRGNYTWVGFDKKPYRLKLDEKAALLGMEKSKHFGLLAHTDDNLGFMRNILGFELSRRLGLAWTPAAEPVELILNNDYLGLYFATELIRVDKKRVNIVEQPDLATDPEAITGGWLVEIDNYDTDPHVSITEGNGARIVFTYKTPEELSPEQESYLREQMLAINRAIYSSDKTSSEWEQLVDIDALARYYIVQEIMDDCESFHGSCYIYRDKGKDKKWIFGPVWDFGNAYQRGASTRFIWDRPAFNQTWIGEIYKFPRFQERVKEIWKEFCTSGYPGLHDFIDAEAARITAAAESSHSRWPQYGNSDIANSAAKIKSLMDFKINWLGKQWGTTPIPDYPEYSVYFRGTQNSWNTSQPLQWNSSNGTFFLDNIDITDAFKLATSDWKNVDLGGDDTPLELNKPYQLKDRGKNITVKDNQPLYNVFLTLDPTTKTLYVTDTAGTDDITPDYAQSWQITGRSISAPEQIEVYNATGMLVASGRGHIALPSAGFYIIVEKGNATKLIAR